VIDSTIDGVFKGRADVLELSNKRPIGEWIATMGDDEIVRLLKARTSYIQVNTHIMGFVLPSERWTDALAEKMIDAKLSIGMIPWEYHTKDLCTKAFDNSCCDVIHMADIYVTDDMIVRALSRGVDTSCFDRKRITKRILEAVSIKKRILEAARKRVPINLKSVN